MRKLLIFLAVIFLPIQVMAADCVILLHGLARSDCSMSKMQKALQVEGYNVVNIGYPSRKYNIEKLAQESISSALEHCENSPGINFVTHSLGGILVRQYLSVNKIANLHHVVMLGPPNKGSEVVDSLGNVPGFKLLNGPAGLQLGTGAMSVPNRLGPAEFSLGIIAGTKTINLILSAIIPNPNDGKVSVESTKLEGMDDHLAMPVTHPFMMRNDKVIQQVIYFLKNGKFKPLPP